MPINTVKQDEKSSSTKKSITLFRLFRYLVSYTGIISIVLLIMLATIGINLANPLILERAINVNIAKKDPEGLLMLGILAVGLNLLLILLIKLRMYLMAKLYHRVFQMLRFL